VTRSFAALAAALSFAGVLLTGAAPALAHGLLVSVQGEGAAVTGRVYYSDGAPGAGEYVELRDLTAPAAQPLTAVTDAGGGFRFPGVAGRSYAVIAHGEEGHITEMQLTLAAGERGRLVDAEARAEGGAPPAWLVIGGLLALSTIPALWLRWQRLRPN
jgi:hypothetical protein